MDKSWFMRLMLVLGLCVLAVYVLYPSYFYYVEATPEQRDDHDAFCDALPPWFHCSKFNLGLDLQGGVHLVMGVRVDKAVEQRADRLADALRDAFVEAKLATTAIERPRQSAEIRVSLAAETSMDAVEKLLRKDFSVLTVLRHFKVGEGERDSGDAETGEEATPAEADGNHGLVLVLTEEEADYVKDTAVEQAIKTIRNRADKLGVSEPTIARRGSDNILIQLPGEKDPQRAIDVIGRTAQLQFTMVDEAGTTVFDEIPKEDLPAGVVRQAYAFAGSDGKEIEEIYFEVPERQREAMLALLEAKIPSNRMVAFGALGGARATGASSAKKGSKVLLRTYLLYGRPGITGDYLTNAQVQQDPDLPANYYVTMTFDAKGSKVFASLTEKNVKRHMAIVLDGRVNSAPIIEEKIGGGTARITLGGAGDPRSRFQEAKDLALVLKAGALPAPVEIREKRQVGESLGVESVRRGEQAIILGLVLVVLFIVVWYRWSGVVANMALLLNVVLVLAVLSLFEATLTLPGMAGILLTIGMAVDANVIIFERIREELRTGRTPRAAIDAGYGKAFSTILDANVTTLIAGVVLMQYGSGPVRGFAVTLIVGILCSMFTAIFVTRTVFDFFTGRRRLQTLSI